MKIMLVDDSRTMRNIQRNTLKQMGHEDFVDAADGKEALVQAGKENPDLILLDWNMPNMNGLEFLTEFRKTNKTTPIIMVTTEAEKHQVLNAITAGVSNYVIKPFTPDALKDKINQTMEKTSG